MIAYGMLRGWDEGYDVPSLGIVVAPAFRGQGYGRSLMHFLHAAAKARGAPAIRLKVYPENSTAVALYQSLGYVFGAKEGGQLVGLLDLR
jgi:ribosomal protein S18 acetylase RimI-like enzyme